jgi:signal peptidase II
MKRQAPYLVFLLVLAVLDQISKAVVARAIPLHGVKSVIPGFFDLTHVRNTGAIFGLMSRSGSRGVTYLLAALSLVALALVVYYFIQTPPSQKLAKGALALILAGALGNQIDRFVRGYVIDFLEIHVGRFHWPTFNLADSSISVGAAFLILTILLRRPHASDPR